MNGQGQIAFAGNRAFRNVNDRQDASRFAFAIPQRRQCIRGLAGLGHKNRERPLWHGRFAVAVFRRHIDLDRYPGNLFEPVFRRQTGIESGAAGDHGDPVEGGEVDARIRKLNITLRRQIMRNRLVQHRWLFRDLFRHKVFVPGLVDPRRVHLDLADGAVRQFAVLVPYLHALARDDRAVAFLQIGDAVSQWRKGDRI